MGNLQKQLNELYDDYLATILKDDLLGKAILNFEISSPILVNVDAKSSNNYENADFKLLYVGQETNYWYNESERREDGFFDSLTDSVGYRDALLNLYANFNIGHNYNTSLFQYKNQILSKLEQSQIGVLWTNILRHDQFGEGKVSPEIEAKITYDNNYIFRRELEILKPDAIVFVTGPRYDYVLQNTFNNLKITQGSQHHSFNAFALLESEELKAKAVRMYHPNYLNRHRARYWDALPELAAQYFK